MHCMYVYITVVDLCSASFGKAFFVMDILHALSAYVREMFMR